MLPITDFDILPEDELAAQTAPPPPPSEEALVAEAFMPPTDPVMGDGPASVPPDLEAGLGGEAMPGVPPGPVPRPDPNVPSVPVAEPPVMAPPPAMPGPGMPVPGAGPTPMPTGPNGLPEDEMIRAIMSGAGRR